MNVLVVVLGDMNDFEFFKLLKILEGIILKDMLNIVLKENCYMYIYEGNV